MLAQLVKTRALERWEKKQKKRKILSDFSSIRGGPAENGIGAIAEFLARYEGDFDLVREALEEFKTSGDFATTAVWRYLCGELEEGLGRLVLEKKVLQEKMAWVESRVPEPLSLLVETAQGGPQFSKLTAEAVGNRIREYLGEPAEDLQVNTSLPLSRAGDYAVRLQFSGGLELTRTIRVQLERDELPPDCADGFSDVPLLSVLGTQDILKQLQESLSKESPGEILSYFPLMASVLRTAFDEGYWKSAWVQSVLQEWRARREEYLLNKELKEAGERLAQINDRGPWTIPEEDDTDNLTERRILEISQGVIERSGPVSERPLDMRVDGGMTRSVLCVQVSVMGSPIGTLTLLRSVPFLPTVVRREIQAASTASLGHLASIMSNDDMLSAANKENREALKVVDGQGRPDYSARSRQLAAICRVLLERGLVDNVQFKRTLSCFYAARGGELFRSSPLQARTYYLLFFRMLFREKMLEYMKAFRALDYPVLANLFATYGTDLSRSTYGPYDHEILESRDQDLEPQARMLWRAGQLLVESPQSFLNALYDLYELDHDFVRNLLINLRRVKQVGAYDLDHLNLDSVRLLRELVTYSVDSSSLSISTTYVLDFILSVLDVRGVAQYVLNEVEHVLGSLRQFVNAKDITQKSALYTDIDVAYLQARRVMDGIIGDRKRYNEETRKKARRLLLFLAEMKLYVDRVHREFFRSARLQVEINTFTLPRYELSPVEVIVHNIDFGLASNAVIMIEKDSSFKAAEYAVPLDPVFGKEERVAAIYLSPLADRVVELRGHIEYSDQEASQKKAIFGHTISISDPAAFESFNSPYVTGNPVRDSEMFFGRRDELDEIIRLLRGHFQDRVTVIHGRRKVGKTSVLYQLKLGNPGLLAIPALRDVQKSYVSVYMDFERFTLEKKTWEVYYYVYQSIRQELDLAGVAVDAISMSDFRDLSADALLASFFADCSRALAPTDQKLLLMFDEFDNLIRIKGEERGLFGFIREIITKYGQQISFIFVGADELLGMMRARTNRLYSMAGSPTEIQELAAEEARLLITEPMRKVNPRFEWAEASIRQIVNLTAGNPYYIQMICDRVVNNLVTGKRLRATSIDVERAVKETVGHIGDLADIVDNLEGPEERVVVTCIAEMAQHESAERFWVTGGSVDQKIRDQATKFPRRVIPSVLRSLQTKYILDQREGENVEMEYSFRVPLLRIYVENSLKLKDALREGGYLQ